MTAADSLQHVYAHRGEAIQQLLARGTPAIGCYGAGIPAELLLATGHTPVAIAPLPGQPTPYADRYFDPGLDPLMRQAFEQLVNGELARLALALFVSHHESDALLYYSCKEVLKRGEGQNLPPLQLHVSLAESSAAAHDYSLLQVRNLASRLRAASGQEASAETLLAASAITNRVRAAGERLLALRRAARLPAVEAFRAIGAGRFLAPQDYAQLLERYLEEREGAAQQDGARVLLISAVSLCCDDLHVAIAAAGAQVTAEEDAWGSRAYGPPLQLAGEPLLALSEYYRSHTPNRGVHPHMRRLQWIYEQAGNADIDAVLIYMPPSDQQLGWDYPRLRNFCAARGKPHFVLRDELFAAGGAERITHATRAFLGELR